MVMAQSLFMRLKQLNPGAAIDVLAPGWSLPLIARMPEVRAGIDMPLGHGRLGLGERRRIGLALRRHGYTRAIVLPGSWKSALVPFFARIPRRSGWRGEMRFGLLNDLRVLDRTVLDTTVRQFVALAEDAAPSTVPPVPPPRLRVDPDQALRRVRELKLSEGPALALMPGAEYGPAKQWPAAHFAAVARLAGAEGRQSWIFGSAKERALGDAIVAESQGQAVNLCGQTSLPDVVDLVARSGAAVSNDSGLMHVAAASGAAVAAVYGSSDPRHTPPLTPRAAVHWLHLSCSPCFQRTCPLTHYHCLRQIAPETVHGSLAPLLSGRAAPVLK